MTKKGNEPLWCGIYPYQVAKGYGGVKVTKIWYNLSLEVLFKHLDPSRTTVIVLNMAKLNDMSV